MVGVLHFIMETWFHFRFGQSLVQLLADYMGVTLLIFSGVTALRNKNANGLLCGAWGYSFCLNYRAFAWRMDEFTAGTSTQVVDNTLIILSITLLFSLAAFIYSIVLVYPSKKW